MHGQQQATAAAQTGWRTACSCACCFVPCGPLPACACGCLAAHPAETDGGYSVSYLLFGTDPAAASDIARFKAVEE